MQKQEATALFTVRRVQFSKQSPILYLTSESYLLLFQRAFVAALALSFETQVVNIHIVHVLQLEDVNYIEHYGLKRRQLAANDK